jgi:nitrogenase subunit NifH
VREYCARREFEIVAEVPFDESITDADRAGQALIDAHPQSAAVVAITRLADTLINRLDAAAPTGS